ncbi:sugar transferase [Sulfurimonas crateris]|uniref:Sugar transferase n=1 Tax=Sulfurimonas crateris TaxID=2574727 RepID=A0A4U2Z8N7_9BACT|nr:sugar transferase [Sulfurimonas crateris]TKI69902.1 sugar transferase [Sulfurimonas crateris]
MRLDKNYILFLVLLAIDVAVLFLAYEIACKIRESLNAVLPFFKDNQASRYIWIKLLIITLLFYEGIYFQRFDFWRETRQILKALLFSFIAVFMILSLVKVSYDFSRSFLVIYFLVLVFLLPFSKRIVKKVLFSIDTLRLPCKVIGKDGLREAFLSEFENNWYLGLKATQESKDIVFVISEGLKPQELNVIIEKKIYDTKSVYIVPYLYQFDFSHTKNIDYFNLRLSAFHLENRLLYRKNIFIKGLAEKILVFLISPLVLALHLFIYIAIKSDSKGKVLFKQKRIGKDGKLFSCYKYRTMYEEQEKLLSDYLQKNPDEVEHYDMYHKYQNDPRITKVGAFLRRSSLDELPQFFNVLRGDMSLIGPRPYMPSEEDVIHEKHKEIIIKVKPGVTGLWQVSGRNNLTFDQRVDMDVWYIQNWSLWMDFVIFMKTIKVVFGKVGAK